MLKRLRPSMRSPSTWSGPMAGTLLALAIIGTAASLSILGHETFTALRQEGMAAFARNEAGQHALVWLLLPIGTAALAVISASLALLSRARGVGRVSPPLQGAAPSDPIAELRELLAGQQGELLLLQQANAAAKQDTLVAGARLTTFALEAQDRLNASVERANASLAQPAAVLDRIAQVMERFEPLAYGALDATRQVNAILEASAGLQRDAAGLHAASREIASAGVHVVTRMSDLVTQLDTAATGLPEAASEGVTLLRQASDGVVEAGDRLKADAAQLDQARDALAEAGALLRADADKVQALEQTMLRHAEAVEAASITHEAMLSRFGQTVETQMQTFVDSAAIIHDTARDATTVAGECREAASGVQLLLTQLPTTTVLINGAIHDLQTVTDVVRDATQGLSDTAERVVGKMDEASQAAAGLLAAPLESLKTGCEAVETVCAEAREQAERLASASSRIVAQCDRQADSADRQMAMTRDAIGQLRAQSEVLGDAALRLMAATPPEQPGERAQLAAALDAMAATSHALRDETGAIRHAAEHLDAASHVLRTQSVGLGDVAIQMQALAREHREELQDAVQAQLAMVEQRIISLADTVARPAADMAEASSSIENAAELRALVAQVARLSDGQQSMSQLLPQAELVGDLSETVSNLKNLSVDIARLSALGASLDTMVSMIPGMLSRHATTQVEAVDTLQSVVGRFATNTVAMMERMDAATSALDAAGQMVSGASAGLGAAVEQVLANQAAPSPVAASVPPLDRLADLEREIVQLLHDSERLAEAALAGQVSGVVGDLPNRAEGILQTVDSMIHGLRSVGTAVALASDSAGVSSPRSAFRHSA